jgi:hypothetical protein
MRTVRITIDFETDATDEQVALMAWQAEVQVADPADTDGERAEWETRGVSSAWSGADTYEGWTNRETWAVALHINNDEGWQESVHDALRGYRDGVVPKVTPESVRLAGGIIRESVEQVLDPDAIEVGMGSDYAVHYVQHILPIAREIGSLWRVDWDELGAAFLADLD